MKPHIVWAVAVYAVAVLAGYVVLVVAGHDDAANAFTTGAIVGPPLIAFFVGMFL